MEQLRELVPWIYFLAAITFILGLKGLSGPTTAQMGNRIAAGGMLLAVVATFLESQVASAWLLIVPAIAIGAAIGFVGARRVPMTAMPQMVAIFNGAGGGAAALVSVQEYLRATSAGAVGIGEVIAILLGLIITDFLLTFIVPSGIARVVIMASIALGLAEAFNSGRGSNVSRGMFLILSYTANIFDKMIIAGAGSITARGLIEKVGGVEVLWSFWFIAFLPCSIVTVLAAWLLTLWLYPPEKVALDGGYEYLRAEIAKMGPWSALEKKAAVLMAVAILLWLTDFIHHISPAIIGIGVGLFALLPRVGILDIEDMKRLNYLPVFFVAAAVSMGTVLEVTKGLEVLTNYMFAWMQPFMTNIFTTTIVMYWTCVRLSLLARQRDFDAWHVDTVGDGICQIARYASAAARHDLDLLRGRKAFRLSIGSSHRRLFIRIFRGARFGAYGRMPHRRGVPRSAFTGPVLLAADRP